MPVRCAMLSKKLCGIKFPTNLGKQSRTERAERIWETARRAQQGKTLPAKMKRHWLNR